MYNTKARMIDFTIWGQGLIQSYGLIGLFVICMVASASVMVILPGWAFIIAAGYFYNPLVVALVAALGSTIGEYTSYLVGRGGNYLFGKNREWLRKIEDWFAKKGFILFPIFAAGPLPMDLLGIVAGAAKYDVWKFFAGVFIGKLIKSLVLAYMGYAGLMILGP